MKQAIADERLQGEQLISSAVETSRTPRKGRIIASSANRMRLIV